MRGISVERTARHMAPEDLAVGTLHDAVVGAVAFGVQNWFHVRAKALVFVGAWIKYLERLTDEHLARGAEHLAHMPVAIDHGAVARQHQAHGGHVKSESVINVHWQRP